LVKLFGINISLIKPGDFKTNFAKNRKKSEIPLLYNYVIPFSLIVLSSNVWIVKTPQDGGVEVILEE